MFPFSHVIYIEVSRASFEAWTERFVARGTTQEPTVQLAKESLSASCTKTRPLWAGIAEFPRNSLKANVDRDREVYRITSLIRKRTPPGPYRRPVPWVVRGS